MTSGRLSRTADASELHSSLLGHFSGEQVMSSLSLNWLRGIVDSLVQSPSGSTLSFTRKDVKQPDPKHPLERNVSIGGTVEALIQVRDDVLEVTLVKNQYAQKSSEGRPVAPVAEVSADSADADGPTLEFGGELDQLILEVLDRLRAHPLVPDLSDDLRSLLERQLLNFCQGRGKETLEFKDVLWTTVCSDPNKWQVSVKARHGEFHVLVKLVRKQASRSIPGEGKEDVSYVKAHIAKWLDEEPSAEA